MKLAENIKTLRKARGWSQAELAEKIGSHLSHITRLETGKYNPSVEDLIKLADTLEVSLDHLVNGKGPEEVRIEDQTFAEKMKLLNSLDKKEREAIITFIDAVLTKKKLLNVLHDAKTG